VANYVIAFNDEARYRAGRIAVAVGWPQEVHRFPKTRPVSRPTGGPRSCPAEDVLADPAARTPRLVTLGPAGESGG